MRLDEEVVVDLVRRSRKSAGLPPVVTDETVLAKVAALLVPFSAGETRPRQRSGGRRRLSGAS